MAGLSIASHVRLGLGLSGGQPRRNLFLTATEDFTDALWIKATATITANDTTSPTGTQTADLATPTGVDSSIRRENTPSAAVPHTYSIYLKSNTGADVSLTLYLQRASPFATVTSSPITITPSWQRFTFTGTPLDTTLHRWGIGGGSTFSTGENIHIWGAQLEVGSAATAYQP